MKLKTALTKAFKPNEQHDIILALRFLAAQPGEPGYHGRMLKAILCEDENPTEEEPL